MKSITRFFQIVNLLYTILAVLMLANVSIIFAFLFGTWGLIIFCGSLILGAILSAIELHKLKRQMLIVPGYIVFLSFFCFFNVLAALSIIFYSVCIVDFSGC